MQKAEQKALTRMKQKIILFCVWVGLLIVVIIFYIFPQFREINAIRSELQANITRYEQYKNNGINIDEIQSTQDNQELMRILATDEGKEFFRNNYIKRPDDTREYLAFLQDKYSKIRTENAKEELKKREQEVSTVIPYFDQWLTIEGDSDIMTDNLSHFSFINYIERLLYTFNLSNDTPLGVQAVYPVNMKMSDIGSIISYIPVQLNVNGSSSDILDFLWFIQHVALIDDVANPDKLTLKRDVVIQNALLTRQILGQENSEDYNIYANQLVDIEEIFFPEYPDRGFSLRGKNVDTIEHFLNFVKWSDQGGHYENLEIHLRFYVRSLPIYKLELAIQDTVKQYDELATKIDTQIAQINSNAQSDTELLNKYRQIRTYLQNHQNDIERFRATDIIKRNINDNYQKAKLIANDIKVISEQIK